MNDQEKAPAFNWKMAGGIGGIASVVLAFSINTAKDAQISLQLAGTHSNQILLVRQQLEELRKEVQTLCAAAYTEQDAARDLRYYETRLSRMEKELEKHKDEK